MTESLKQSIETSAAKLRAAKHEVQRASQAIHANEKRIESLEAEIEKLQAMKSDLREAYSKAYSDAAQLTQKYTFYCNEAIELPSYSF